MSPVRLDFDGPLAVITLDAPPLNLFDAAMMAGLAEAVAAVAASEARALLIQANGRAVSGGVDVNTFAPLTPEMGEALWEEWFGFIHMLEDLPFPTIFAAHALVILMSPAVSLARQPEMVGDGPNALRAC